MRILRIPPLLTAIAGLEDGSRPILHSDCRCRYKWPGGISICDAESIVRSMFKKASSPDNAACEAFFGRLKNESFYYGDWEGVSFEEFSMRLDSCIDYYNKLRKKKALGWLSPVEYRKALGYVA